jgi:predicted nucleotidyltransferase
MAIRIPTKDKHMRQRLAQEAARLMAEEGVQDFYTAKRKAAERLGAPNTQNMPRNTEIEEALQDYQRLFLGAEGAQQLQRLREAALQAMRFFANFEPRLAGSVLTGTAGEHSDVNLHLFADAPEEVNLFLLDAGIHFEVGLRRMRLNRETSADIPSVRFLAGGQSIEALIFPADGIRQAPLSPVDGKPMARATLGRVEELLAQEPESTL